MKGFRKVMFLIALAGVMFGMASCEKAYYPVYPQTLYFDITIRNETPLEIWIYLDGGYLCYLSPYSQYTAYDISEGTHLLEAFDADDVLLASRSFYLHDTFIWILE